MKSSSLPGSLVCVLISLACLSLLSGAEPRRAAPATAKDQLAAELESHPGLTYARYGARTLELDLFRPKNRRGPLPAIVGVHGGGWQKGTRANFAAVARALAARGYVTVTISYRLSDEAPFPAQIEDCKAAVRWLRAHAGEFGIDAGRIGAIGHSAGGHLVALLATSAGVPALEGSGGNAGFSSAIQASVAMGAQTDFESERNGKISAHPQQGAIWRKFLGGSQAERPAIYRLASPLHHLDRSDPPLAFVTGEHDDPSTHADVMRQQLTAYGIATGLTVIVDAPHPFLGNPAWFGTAIDAAADFFAAHLGSHPVK